jgi:ribonuclease HI
VEQVTTLDSLLRYLTLPAADWDYLIVCDGSGTVWPKEMGWGSVLLCQADGERQIFGGSMSNGTNNVAELMGALHPLMFLANNDMGLRPDGIRVHIVTDSEYVANGLAKDNPIWVSKLNVNRELWMAIHMVRRRGLTIVGHHVPRDKIDLQKICHDIANINRKRQIGVLSELTRDVYTANPLEAEDAGDGQRDGPERGHGCGDTGSDESAGTDQSVGSG